MGIAFDVLGDPGQDNALLVNVDTGQAIHRLLFDCGDNCLSRVPVADVLAIDHLFLSHLHIDHIAGFDGFFRCVFNRGSRPNRIWGPPGTSRILQHRFQGFLWNLHEQMQGTWHVTDVEADRIVTARFELNEAFAIRHEEAPLGRSEVILDTSAYSVEAVTMDHRTATLAYVVREEPRRNIDVARLGALGLRPGPWLKELKDPAELPATVTIDGQAYPAADLVRELVVESPGDSIAYLTDFLLDDAAMAALVPRLRGCGTVVCEAQYRHADLELSRRNFHMTTVLGASLAQRAEVGELVLFHLSERYTAAEWQEMLDEARQVFPATRFPSHWAL